MAKKLASEPFLGLTAEEVKKRVDEGKTNYVSKKTTRSIWYILRTNLITYFNVIVIGSFTVLFVLGQWKDALFGLAAIANVIIGVTQEYRSKRLLDKLVLLHSPKTTVIRGGQQKEVNIDDIVIDDTVFLRLGDQIPADGKVLSSDGLEVNESLLTGEVDPINKEEGDKVMSGSIVVAGSAYMKVTSVGQDSYASRLTSEAKRFSLVHSELRSGIDRVLKLISFLIVPIFGVVIFGQISSYGGLEALKDSEVAIKATVGGVASIVAMIPLGLVLITSVAFAAGAVRLLRHRVLMQELAAVEGLARADVVCFDKTGTLTEGEIVYDETIKLSKTNKAIDQAIGWFANEPNASASMQAIASVYRDGAQFIPSKSVAFSSSRKWSAIAFDKGPLSGSWVLGAPEKLIDYTDPRNEKALMAVNELAEAGKRTLVLCHYKEDFKHSKLDEQTIKEAFKPVAVIGLKETLRKDVIDTLRYLKNQGVELRLLSGDNVKTVTAIAREVGIEFEGDGYDARKLPNDIGAMGKILDEHVVFGRVDPDQKKDIVMALQSRGHVVAMVGDGVNDAMAVKQADIGVAMGSGSAATRAVARLVLLDSDFTQFPRVIAMGRQVIANIERVALLFLSKTVYIMILSIAFGLMAWGFPFLPRHLSAIDGLTIGIPAFFLALMPSARRYLPGFLERTLRLAIPNGIIVALAIITMKLYILNTGPYEGALGQTAMAISMALIGLWILVTQSRPFILPRALIVISMYVGLIGVIMLPIVKDFFYFELPSGQLLFVSLFIGLIGSVLVELVNRIFRGKVR